METFYPSEVARLVLGYLKEEQCLKAWQTFLEESSNLEEYCNLYKKGRVYSTNVNGNSLLDILNEYCVLKSEIINNDSNKPKSLENAYNISESEILKAIRKDLFLETTKNAIDSVFQKYLSSTLNENSSLSNPLIEVHPSKAKNSNKEYENSHNTTKDGSNANECGDKQRKLLDITSEIKNKITMNKSCDQDIVLDNLDANKSDAEVNIVEKNKNDALKQVSKSKDQQNNWSVTDFKLKNNASTSDFISKQFRNSDHRVVDPAVNDRSNRDSHYAQHKSLASVENLSSNSECIVKENAVSSSELIQIDDDDDDLEIIKEVKVGNFNNGQFNQSPNCQKDLVTSNCPTQKNNSVINVKTNNSNNVMVNQVCSVQHTITKIDTSKQKVNSQENDLVRNVQASNNSLVEINQAAMCNDSIQVNQINNVEHTVSSSNDQTNYNIGTGSFVNNPIVINKLPVTAPRYILPSFSSNGSLANNNNNTQFYIVLNTPMASNVGGTYMTVPGVQTNITKPVLPAASTTCVKNTATVSNVSNSLPSIAPAGKISLTSSNVSNSLPSIAPAGKISLTSSKTYLVNADGKFRTASKVSEPEPTIETQSIAKRSQTEPRVHQVSYAQYLESDSESDEPNSLKTRKKRKKVQRKVSPNKKTNKKNSPSAGDEVGQLQKASMSEKQSTGENSLLTSVIRESPSTGKGYKKKSGKNRNSKKNKKSQSVNITPYCEVIQATNNKEGATYSRCKNDFGQHLKSSQISSLDPSSKALEVTSRNSIFSKTASEANIDQSAAMKDNRVLKVVLSDVFLDSKLKPNQCPESYLNLAEAKDSQGQTSNSKLTVQNRQSPREHKVDAKHSDESQSTDTRPQQKIKVTDTAKPELLSNKRKVHQSTEKNKSNLSSFNMTAAELYSMARQLVTNPKNRSSSLTKELTSQSSFKNITACPTEPKSSFQSAIQDMGESTVQTELENNDKLKKHKLLLSKNRSPVCSLAVNSNLNPSVNEDNKIDKDQETLRCSKNMVSDERVNFSENISDLEKSSSFLKTLLKNEDLKKNYEAEKIIALKASNKDLSDIVNEKEEITVEDCTEDKKLLLTNSLSSLHQVNVSRVKTCVARKLNFTDKLFDYNFNAKINAVEREDSRSSSCNIFKANAINIENDNPDIIHHTAETSVLSVLTSISTNTKVLDIAETHNVTKPHSEALNVSNLSGENAVNVLLPSTSGQLLESQNCVFTTFCTN